MPKRKTKFGCVGWLFAIVVLLCGGGFFAYTKAVEPLPKGSPIFLRYENGVGMIKVLASLEDRGIIRSRHALRIYAFLYKKTTSNIKSGTYQVWRGMTAEEVYRAFENPVRQMVRMPETNWARRSANLLERANVTSAEEYMKLWADPKKFDSKELPLSSFQTLEGFLYPDTYDFPPMLGAEGAVQRQLANFRKKVLPLFPNQDNLYKILIVASLVELEVAKDSERPIVAGVIYNRLKKNMRLEIDATINYALQKWRPLTFKDLRETNSPFNTYRNTGLPPTPICSPSLASIQAAKEPANHTYLFYVAMPEKFHLFATTYEEHLKNIAKRKAALRALNP